MHVIILMRWRKNFAQIRAISEYIISNLMRNGVDDSIDPFIAIFYHFCHFLQLIVLFHVVVTFLCNCATIVAHLCVWGVQYVVDAHCPA